MVANTLTFTDIGKVGAEWEFVGIGDYVGGAATDFLMRHTGTDALVVGSVANGTMSFTTLAPGWNA
jgi:hypothetical protein